LRFARKAGRGNPERRYSGKPDSSSAAQSS
jgi:hypothetical protein